MSAFISTPLASRASYTIPRRMKQLFFILPCLFLLALLAQAGNAQSSFAVEQANVCPRNGNEPILTESLSCTYHANGRLDKENPINDGKREGRAKRYDESGKLSYEESYKNDKLDGLAKTYHKNGSLSGEWPFKDGKKGGILKLYNENGQLEREEAYKDDKKEWDKFYSYHGNGKLEYERYKKNDYSEGLTKTYYENGQLESEIRYKYKDYKPEGIFKSYYDNGKLRSEVPYKGGQDKPEGLAKSYYESGALESEWPYKDGKKDGLAKTYRENGKLFVTIEYKNDSPVSGMCHHIDGTQTALTNAELTNWENGLNIYCNSENDQSGGSGAKELAEIERLKNEMARMRALDIEHMKTMTKILDSDYHTLHEK